MKWFIGGSSDPTPSLPADHPPVPADSGAKCPVDHKAMAAAKAAAEADKDKGAKCPIDHSKMSSSGWVAPPPRTDANKCPIDGHGSPEGPGGFAGVFGGSLSPVNNIPVGLSATEKAPGQKMDLSTERTLSNIPRPQEDGEAPVWEYPSPQQFYNALVRKGWETPEESIQMVVDIHNWINEGGWDQIMRWEKRLPGGEHATLARFQGRPGDLSPRARFNLLRGWLLPKWYQCDPPFDRHDWVVTRPVLDADGKPTKQETEQRYVIDYYHAGTDENGNEIFSLDARPALDNFTAVSERVKVAAEEFQDWVKGSFGGQGGQ